MQIRIKTQLPSLASGMVSPIQSAYQSVRASLQDSDAPQGSRELLTEFRPSKGTDPAEEEPPTSQPLAEAAYGGALAARPPDSRLLRAGIA
jgi:hypothetical protein